MRAASLAFLAMITACTTRGVALRDWTFEADGLPPRPMTLPGHVFDQLGFVEMSYTLEHDVTVEPQQRSAPFTLAVDCFHGSLGLTVDGQDIPDAGDTAAGEHRYEIAARGRQTLRLVLHARQETCGPAGFGLVPRWSTGAVEVRITTIVNRCAAIADYIVAAMLVLVNALLFFFDRRRREHIALGVSGLATLAVIPAYFGMGSSVALTVTTSLAGVVTWGAILYVIYLSFDLGPPPRRWLAGLGLASVLPLLYPLSFRMSVCAWLLETAIGLAFYCSMVNVLVRLTRTKAHRKDALINLVVGYLPVTATLLVEDACSLRGVNLVGGLHPVLIGMLLLMLAYFVMMTRQFAARQRALELNSAELQRQVAERSKDLADALGKLAQQRRAGNGERTIDGRYRIVSRIGAGGMGSVYEVERTSDHQRLALKTVRGTSSIEATARLAREAHIAAAITHPNLVPVLDVGIADGELFVVMPLIAGGSLEGERMRFGDAAWARPRLAQIAAGLAALHERGIVHRDLKPSNILLDGLVARIADFGLASRREQPDALGSTLSATGGALTRAGDVFGTPAYMAPELADGVHDPAPSSDVFAFGLIAYELLFGRAPFAEPPLLARLAGRTIPPARDGLDPLLARCLDLDPARRPTAAELAATLR